jgi:hypothetical protein
MFITWAISGALNPLIFQLFGPVGFGFGRTLLTPLVDAFLLRGRNACGLTFARVLKFDFGNGEKNPGDKVPDQYCSALLLHAPNES